MPLAWIDPPGLVRDVAPANPTEIYHPDVAAFYTTAVPDGTANGATKQGNAWINPPPPPAVEAGPPPPAPVPLTITPLQARRALRAAGLLSTVNAWIAAQAEDVQEAWEYCVEVRRDNALIAGAQAALGLTEAQIDELFRTAAEILA